jgi:dipeptidyl aminopeptidase/acylaminoacyl peptidase
MIYLLIFDNSMKFHLQAMAAILFPAIFSTAQSQVAKKPIDLNAIKNWESLGSTEISADGKYYYYVIDNENGSHVMIVNAINKSWSKEITSVSSGYFTADGKRLIFNRNDSIGFMYCNNPENIQYISGSALQTSGKHNKYLFWTSEESGKKQMTVWNQSSQTKSAYSNVIQHQFSADETMLLLTTMDNDSIYHLSQITLSKNKSTEIWSGKILPKSVKINSINNQVAFMVKDAANKQINICFIKPGDSPTIISEQILQQGDTTRHIDQLSGFSKNGKYLFFTTVPPQKKSDPDSVQVDIWSFTDKIIPSRKKVLLSKSNPNECGMFNLQTQRTIYFDKDLEDTYLDFNYYNYNKDVVLLKVNEQTPTERQFSQDGPFPNHTLMKISLQDGNKKTVYKRQHTINVSLSPDGRYIVYFNLDKQQLEVYDTQTELTRSIATDILLTLKDKQFNELRLPFNMPLSPPIGWTDNGQFILIADKYDIWKIDLAGKKPSVCLTKGYCRENNILMELLTSAMPNETNVFSAKDRLIFKSTSLDNYTQQLFSLSLGKRGTFTRLTGGDFNYGVVWKSKNRYIVTRNGMNDAPDYYLSSDLVHFQQLTDFQPQHKYSWYTRERVEYQLSSGKINKGLLYKPDNFDSTKKYPVIFSIYESKSAELYNFHGPALSDGTADDPAWWTSRGYLLFTPDVIHTFGNPSAIGYDAIVSGAKYLQTKSWVAGNKIGLVGTSHGAFIINHVITKCHLFAAAAPGAGIVNWISGYGTLRSSGLDRSYVYETDQSKAGVSLWENKQMYIDNSSILNADSVQTPLLILHNKEDGAVPFEQGLSWFLAMRRLGKPAWMLQYEGEGHGVFEEKNTLDFTNRLEQFLNHYLKDEPKPEWMK